MPEPEDQQLPDVSTEPQRQALDEMSRQLVDKLNAMVREQHERAHHFAATQHSLSPLPGVPPVEPPPYIAEQQDAWEATPQPAPAVEKPAKKRLPFFSPHSGSPKRPQNFDAKPQPSKPRTAWSALEKKAAEEAAKKKGESGCGTVPTLVAIIIIVIILRSCS